MSDGWNLDVLPRVLVIPGIGSTTLDQHVHPHEAVGKHILVENIRPFNLLYRQMSLVSCSGTDVDKLISNRPYYTRVILHCLLITFHQISLQRSQTFITQQFLRTPSNVIRVNKFQVITQPWCI